VTAAAAGVPQADWTRVADPRLVWLLALKLALEERRAPVRCEIRHFERGLPSLLHVSQGRVELEVGCDRVDGAWTFVWGLAPARPIAPAVDLLRAAAAVITVGGLEVAP
jgi:hypothetical protein